MKERKTKEATAWKKLATETRKLPHLKSISDKEIEEQIDAYRQFMRDDSKEDQIYESFR
jgi:hypothetical protein